METEDKIPPRGDTVHHDWWKRPYLEAKRWIAIASAILAIWIVIGACTDWRWWYGLIWGGDLSVEYISTGFQWLLDTHFLALVLIVIAIVLAFAFLSTSLAHRFVPHKFAGRIILCSGVIIFVDALFVYHFGREPYNNENGVLISLQELASKADSVVQRYLPPAIEAPIYFFYLDEKRANALYNQIESEMTEQEREVTHSNSVKGKAGAAIGDSGVEIEGEKSKEQKSKFNRPDFSPDRKCLEVMRYTRKIDPESYYSSPVDWYSTKAFAEIQLALQAHEITNYSQLHQIEPLTPDRIDADRKKQEIELKSNLESLHGLTFVDGDFEESVSGDSLILTEKFSVGHPFKCVFRVSFPKAALEALPKTKPLHLRVFGDVSRPLSADGFVDVVGIAVF